MWRAKCEQVFLEQRLQLRVLRRVEVAQPLATRRRRRSDDCARERHQALVARGRHRLQVLPEQRGNNYGQ